MTLSTKLQNLNASLLDKTCIFELKPYFFFTVTKKDTNTFYLLFKNNFILVLCNKIK